MRVLPLKVGAQVRGGPRSKAGGAQRLRLLKYGSLRSSGTHPGLVQDRSGVPVKSTCVHRRSGFWIDRNPSQSGSVLSWIDPAFERTGLETTAAWSTARAGPATRAARSTYAVHFALRPHARGPCAVAGAAWARVVHEQQTGVQQGVLYLVHNPIRLGSFRIFSSFSFT